MLFEVALAFLTNYILIIDGNLGSSSALPLSNEMDDADPTGVLPKSNSMLVISGGEGYIDFRVGKLSWACYIRI